MKRIALTIAAVAALLAPSPAPATVAGKVPLGVAVAEMNAVVLGWSAKKDVLGKTVYNEKGDKVGTVDDVIITPDNAVSFAIIGAGGFVGLAKHDVAIPMGQIKIQEDRFVLEGATKDAIKALPNFEYAKK